MKTYPALPRIHSGTVLLSVDFGMPMPEEIDFKGKKWPVKAEFHVTLIGYGHKALQKITATSHALPKDVAEGAFRASARDALEGISFEIKLDPCLYYVVKTYPKPNEHTRQTIMAGCSVGGAEEFNRRFFERTKIEIRDPFYHVTLYTHPDEMSRQGIGLTDKYDVSRYARPIEASLLPQKLPIF
jgi:hypothetical protein